MYILNSWLYWGRIMVTDLKFWDEETYLRVRILAVVKTIIGIGISILIAMTLPIWSTFCAFLIAHVIASISHKTCDVGKSGARLAYFVGTLMWVMENSCFLLTLFMLF